MKFFFTSILLIVTLNASSQRLTTAPAKNNSVVDSLKNIPLKHIIAPNLYTRNLAFFCKQELKLEKATSVKLRFRLGSVEQTDFLEGKRKPVILNSLQQPAH